MSTFIAFSDSEDFHIFNLQLVLWYAFKELCVCVCVCFVLVLILSVFTYLFTPWCRVLLEKLTGL